jgi:crotonobetaine/carnitine-CoA ligase
VAVGEVGELAVRPRVAGTLLTEYFGRPDATLRAFRNLWFHTGDAVRRDPDGHYYFVDRMGDRIRHRGETFSSFQVEDVLNAHPAVALSAAFGIPSAEGEEDDVAVFVVPRDGATIDVAELRAYAERELPRAMRPAIIRVVNDLPRTPTNKVEKYRLKAELLRELSTGAADTSPGEAARQ